MAPRQFADLDDALARLRSSGNDAAFAAGRLLNRRANGNWTQANKEWFTAQSTVNGLLEALKTSALGARIEIIGTLGALSQRYDCRDARIHDALVSLADGGDDLPQSQGSCRLS